jgi:hypothetical protein
MVTKYYVSVRPQINENHAIHKEGCPFLPNDEKRIFLGEFSSGKDAVRESQRHFSKTKGCIFCSKEQKTSDDKPSLSSLVNKDTIDARLKGPISYHQTLICCLN